MNKYKIQSKLTMGASKKQKIEETYLILKKGFAYNDIVDWLISIGTSIRSSKTIIKEAWKLVDNELFRDVDIIMGVHTQRYENIWKHHHDAYKTFIEHPEEKHEFAHNAQIVSNYRNVLRALFQKERLLGLHSREVTVVLSHFQAKFRQKEGPGTPGTIDTKFKKFIDEFDFSSIPIEDRISARNMIIEIMFDNDKSKYDSAVEDVDYIEIEDEEENKEMEVVNEIGDRMPVEDKKQEEKDRLNIKMKPSMGIDDYTKKVEQAHNVDSITEMLKKAALKQQDKKHGKD